MDIRATEGMPVRVPASDGDVVEVRIQGMQARATAAGGEAVATLPERLYFGNRREVEGRVWRGKAAMTLVMERRDG